MNNSRFDYCKGFLGAMALLNCQLSDVYACYEIFELPAAEDLHSALVLHYVANAKTRKVSKDVSAERWNVATVQIVKPIHEVLREICTKWFFQSSHMFDAPKEHSYRHNTVVTFVDSLIHALGETTAHDINMYPPYWYAMAWEEMAFECGDNRYMLHFSHSD